MPSPAIVLYQFDISSILSYFGVAYDALRIAVSQIINHQVPH